jgi:hypothetical protein
LALEKLKSNELGFTYLNLMDFLLTNNIDNVNYQQKKPVLKKLLWAFSQKFKWSLMLSDVVKLSFY